MSKKIKHFIITFLSLAISLILSHFNYGEEDITIAYWLTDYGNSVVWVDSFDVEHIGTTNGENLAFRYQVKGADTLYEIVGTAILPTPPPGVVTDSPSSGYAFGTNLDPNEEYSEDIQWAIDTYNPFQTWLEAYHGLEAKRSMIHEINLRQYIGFYNAITFSLRSDQRENFRRSLEDIKQGLDSGIFNFFMEPSGWNPTDSDLANFGVPESNWEDIREKVNDQYAYFIELIDANGGIDNFIENLYSELQNLIIVPYTPENENDNLYGRWWGPGSNYIMVRIDNWVDPYYDTYNPIVIFHETLHKAGLPGSINVPPPPGGDIEIMVGWLAKKFYLLIQE